MKMKNNIIKTLAIALIAIVLGSGMVTAAHVGSHGAAYMTPDGLAELKSGDLTGDYTCWNDNDVQHHKTCIVNVDGVDYEITYKVAGGSGAKIVGAQKVVTEPLVVDSDDEQTESYDEPAVDETNDGSDSESKATDIPVVPETEPVVVPETEPVVVPETEPVVVPEPETAPVENETANNDVTVAPAANNTIENETANNDVTVAPAANNTIENETANNDVAGIVMQKAGNPIVLCVIAILVLIGAVAYKRY